MVRRLRAWAGPSEEVLHAHVAQYLSLVIRPPAFWTTFPAGGGGRVRGGKLKARGLKAGMPDILIFQPALGPLDSTIVLGLELKTAKGALSPSQKSMGRVFECFGGRYLVARSLDEVALLLRAAGLLVKPPAGPIGR